MHASPIAIVNRLRTATLEGRLLWRSSGEVPTEYKVVLDEGHSVIVAKVPAGTAVVLTMANADGKPTLHLDSGRVKDDLLRLALLQLYVAVRDRVAALALEDAARAVEDL